MTASLSSKIQLALVIGSSRFCNISSVAVCVLISDFFQLNLIRRQHLAFPTYHIIACYFA